MLLGSGDLTGAARFGEINLGHARANGDPWSVGSASDQMALVALLRGDLPAAAAWVRETVPRCLAANQLELVAYGLKVLAIAGAAAEPTKAARLFGAAESLRDVVGVAIWPVRREIYEQGQAAVREQLGGVGFDAAWAEGRALSASDAVAYALLPPAVEVDTAAWDRSAPRPDPAQALTAREREVAALIASGLTSKEAADRLSVSERTIDAHADHIRTKLDLRSRAEIATWAVFAGLPRPERRSNP